MIRKCKECGRKVKGKVGKIFCTELCCSRWHNRNNLAKGYFENRWEKAKIRKKRFGKYAYAEKKERDVRRAYLSKIRQRALMWVTGRLTENSFETLKVDQEDFCKLCRDCPGRFKKSLYGYCGGTINQPVTLCDKKEIYLKCS